MDKLIIFVFCLLNISSLLLVQCASLVNDADVQPIEVEDPGMLKRALRDVSMRHLRELEAAEEYVLKQIKALEAQRQEIIAKKRGHNQCMLSVIACYT